MTIESDLLAGVSALLGRRNLTQAEMAAWFGGAADGGPAGDGMFPLTDSTGFTRMVPSPARQMADVAAGGGFNLTGFNALPKATEAQVAAGVPQVVGRTLDGKLLRFPTDLFAARRTKDIDVLPGSEYAEWMSCLSSTGQERKIAVAALTSAFGGVIDPSKPPFNVKFDAQRMFAVTRFKGMNLVWAEYTDARFSQADIGKLAFVSNYTFDNVAGGYIGQVSQDGRQAFLFTDRTFSTPFNCQQDSRAYEQIVWGTDGTAGMQAALDAAEPRAYEDHGRTVAIGGFAMVSRLRFGSVSLVGLSPTGCGFYHISAGPGTGGLGDPWIGPKSSGMYTENRRPHHYTLMNLTLFGQQYTVNYGYGNYRRVLQIYGGGFGDVYLGAGYSRLENIDIYDSPWDGFMGDGVFGGFITNFRTFFNRGCGMRVGFYDLNGANWHAEGNKQAGVYSTLVGANVSTVRLSFNGEYGAGSPNPHEHGSNWTEAGFGNTVTNLRAQESWSHNLCFSDVDTNGIRQGGGSGNAFYLGTFDDTGDVSSLLNNDGSPQRSIDGLPDVRAMIYFRKTADQYNYTSASTNTVELVTGSYQVRNVNYATNGVGVDGYARANEVTLRTPHITNAPADWYDGVPIGKPALSRGPWVSKNIGGATIGSLDNIVTVNRQVAP